MIHRIDVSNLMENCTKSMLKLMYGKKKIHWQDIEHKGDNRVNKCGGIRFGIKHSKTTKCFVDMLIH